MLKIRQEQMQAFGKGVQQNFEDDMVKHLQDHSPEHAAALQEKGLRRVIRHGLERAAAHQFTERGTVQLYLELMFLLGSAFDTDPQFPWAAEILAASTAEEQAETAEKLQEKAGEYHDQVAGPDNEYAKQSRQRALQRGWADLPAPGPHFDSRMLELLAKTYPEKYDYIGKEALQRLVSTAPEAARRYDIAGTGVGLFAALMYALGHGFHADPLYPWVANTLTNREITDPQKRAERLFSKAMTYAAKAADVE